MDLRDFLAELRVSDTNANEVGGLWAGFDPHGASTAALRQVERVIADNNSGPFYRERDQSAGEQSCLSEFIDDLKHNSCGIGTVADDDCIVYSQKELVCGGVGRE